MAKAMEKNGQLLVLNCCRNHITSEASEAFVTAMNKNESLTMLDLSTNEVPVNHSRKLESIISVNRECLHNLRKNELRERNAVYAEEYYMRTIMMERNARRLACEAIEERRQYRMKQQHEAWEEDAMARKEKEAQAIIAEDEAAAERKKAAKGKKKKK